MRLTLRLVLLSSSFLLSVAASGAPAAIGPKFPAKVTTSTGETFTVPDLRRNAGLADIHLDVGDYSLIFPFEIVKKIDLHLGKASAGERGLRGELLLGDGTVVKGRTWGTVVRHTDLGDVVVELDKVREIEFLHEPSSKYAFKPRGKHTAVLQLDGEAKTLIGATFVDDFHEEHLKYFDHFFFELKGNPNPIEVAWEKIRYLTPGDSKLAGTAKYAALVVTTREATEYRGACSRWSGMPQTIEGSLQFSPGYLLAARVNVPGMSDKGRLKRIELK